MSNLPQSSEIIIQNPDPVELLDDLDAMNTDQKKFNYLRTLFIEKADLDEYIQYLDTDEEIALTIKQLKRLKNVLADYGVYLEKYLEQTAKRIIRFEERGEANLEAMRVHVAEPAVQERLFGVRRRISRAMQIANAPRGVKGRSLRDATGKSDKAAIAGKLGYKTEAQYIEYINDMSLTTELKEKLNLIITGYDEAVATVKELDPNILVPSKEQIIANIITLGVEKMRKIVTIMGKPGLIIEPDKSFIEMKDAMNEKRHFDRQNEAYFEGNYEWSGRPGKVSVSIMDLIQNPAVVPGQKPRKQRNDEQLRICEKYFRDNGMSLVSDRQFAVGMQDSLRAYENAKKKREANPEKHILDFYSKPEETVTIFNQEHNAVINKVAFGRFRQGYREVYLFCYNPGSQDNRLRGRGVVQVM